MRDGIYANIQRALAILRKRDQQLESGEDQVLESEEDQEFIEPEQKLEYDENQRVLQLEGFHYAPRNKKGDMRPGSAGLPKLLDFSKVMFLSMKYFALSSGTQLIFNKSGNRTGCYFEDISGWSGKLDFGSAPEGFVSFVNCDMSNISEINIEETLNAELRNLKNLNCAVTLGTAAEPLSAVRISGCDVSDKFHFLHVSQLKISGGKLSGHLDFSNVDNLDIAADVDISEVKSVKFNPNGNLRGAAVTLKDMFKNTPSQVNVGVMTPQNIGRH